MGSGYSSAASQTSIAVGPQYDTTHVYVDPEHVDSFAKSFLATFGGSSTNQVIATVTPTPSSTTSQLLQTPVGTVSLFGFKTPIPHPFGLERTGYLVEDMDRAVAAARKAGAAVVVEPFPDPIGRDAVIQWPGGVNMQLYWHTRRPDYPALASVPENRVYVSKDAVGAFLRDFLLFSGGRITSDVGSASGREIGRENGTYRRVRLDSQFGKTTVFVTDGHLPYPYGHEFTGYEVEDLQRTLEKAKASGATVLVQPYHIEERLAAMVEFPGGYIAEIHQIKK
ncbi:MAG: glyoxalase [Rhizobium sp.]|jgi:predicted enzyme related to lactoylglutathione lyase|uniref:glyoxalase n=1 Tax=Rhizobium sp. TaxID=391 RepID=UPI0030F0F4D0